MYLTDAPDGQSSGGRESDSDVLRELFALLRARSGHDFSSYKRATVLRRIGRRMQFSGVSDLASYMALLRERSGEAQLLIHDLLISVTNFFRDRGAFEALQADLPGVFAGKGPTDYVRAWVAGCATGEEAYSVAIMLHEHAATLAQPPAVQVFATDIDEIAIAAAREGLYRSSIAADVSAERLRRFFTEEQGGYRVKKEIRSLALFAPHDLLRDPPFSRLDLVTCRNLLIYLDRDVQDHLLKLFHFVLRPGGRLMLGGSETVDGAPGLFTVLDKRHRIYARMMVDHAAPALPFTPLAHTRRIRPPLVDPSATPQTISYGELHQRLLEEYAPPSLLVNEAYEIVHLSCKVGRYLQLSGGEPSYNLLNVIHPDLRLDLRTTLFRASHEGRPSEARKVRLAIDGRACLVNIIARPAVGSEGAQGFLLVLFEELEEAAGVEPALPAALAVEPMVRQLEQELQAMHEQLRLMIEQYETSTEELEASNEELQAMNEELRSASEELETSEEELQSVNEELTTINQELKSKVDEICRVNADLQNLMASIDIGTIFLDRELRVKRFTPRAQEIFNLIAADINRPLAHITHRLVDSRILEEPPIVLDRAAVVDREVQHRDGRWFLGRVLPYRTMEATIDGVVLTFIDITERKRAEAAITEAKDQLKARVAERTAALEAEVAERRQVEAVRQALLRRLVSAQEEERRTISREIHDQLGQQLAGLKLSLRALKGSSYGRSEALSRIEELEALVDTISQEMRQLSRSLRPTILDDLGLSVALATYADEWSQRSGLPVAFHSSGLEEVRLPAVIETTIYRVVLEAMLNVLKHAEASQVSLILECKDDAAVAIIEDNGVGFDAEAVLARPAQWGLGILGMNERVSLVDGTLTVESTPGAGTTVFVRVPISQEPEGGPDSEAARHAGR